MSETIDETIQAIAVRHGVALGKDDPILILQTMNEKLLEENRRAQQEMLAQFKEEMENISSQWKDDAKEKAEKVLNAALAGSKEVIAKLLHESTSESVQAIKVMISNSLIETHNLVNQSRKISMFAMVCSSIILSGALLFKFIFM